VAIDGALAGEAAALAAHFGLGGADACDVALARRYRTSLITLDEALIRHAAAAADIVTPDSWLARTPG
jgi:predicted nucleic acid-binding protein